MPVSKAAKLAPAYHTTENTRQELRDEPEPHALRYCRLLDFPSDSTEVLDLLFTQGLRKLNMVADGKAAYTGVRVKGSDATLSEPRSTLSADLSRFEWRWEKCRTHRARLKLIRELQIEVAHLKFAQKVAAPGSREWREEVARREGTNVKVCAIYGVSEQTLRNYRREFGIKRACGRPRSKTPKSLPNPRRANRFQHVESERRLELSKANRRLIVTFTQGASPAAVLSQLGLAFRSIWPDVEPTVTQIIGAAFSRALLSSEGLRTLRA